MLWQPLRAIDHMCQPMDKLPSKTSDWLHNRAQPLAHVSYHSTVNAVSAKGEAMDMLQINVCLRVACQPRTRKAGQKNVPGVPRNRGPRASDGVRWVPCREMDVTVGPFEKSGSPSIKSQLTAHLPVFDIHFPLYR
jgi:hypothetical protein